MKDDFDCFEDGEKGADAMIACSHSEGFAFA